MTTLAPAEHRPRLDEAGIGQLQSMLHRYCLSLTRSGWDAEDLAQETWMKALEKLRSGHSNPEALVLRIAKNAWLDIGRRQSVLKRKLPLLSVDTAAGPETPSAASVEMVFQTLLEHLTPLQRAVFLLRDALDYSAAETAELLGTSEGAVKAALHRARQALPALREELEREGPALPEDPALRERISRMAAAYMGGRIAELIGLAQGDGSAAGVTLTVVGGMHPAAPARQGGTGRGPQMHGCGAVMALAA